MFARKVPMRATARLDHQAKVSGARISAGQPEAAVQAPKRRITWLADMLTADTNSFGVMRLLLALAVLVSHSIYLTTGQGQLEPLYRWTNYTLGQHGVQVFFFLSGILVTQSLFASGSLRDFATARALRIFPALIVCVLMTALVLGPLVTTLPPVDYLKHQGVAAYIAKTASLWSGSAQLPSVFASHTVAGAVNTSVWTLKYEVLCYVILGLAGFAVLMTPYRRAVAVALLAVWATVILAMPAGLELHGGAKSTVEVLRYFTTFFGAGVLAYALRQWIPVHAVILVPLGALFAVSIGGRYQEAGAAIFLGYLAIWVSTFRFGGLRAFTNSNDYSYATYLYHMPVSQALLHVWPDLHVVPLILATTAIALWIAFFSWELVERPALALRHRLWSNAAPAQGSTLDAPLTKAKSIVAAGVAGVRALSPRTEAIAPAPETSIPAASVALDAVTTARAATRRQREKPARSAARHVAARTAARDEGRAVGEGRAIHVRPACDATIEAATNDLALPPEATAGHLQPGAAKVWRPMPTPKKLRIFDDAAEATGPGAVAAAIAKRRAAARSVAPSQSSVAPAIPVVSHTATLKPLMPRELAATMAPDNVEAEQAPMPSVPASRLAFATKRPARAAIPPQETRPLKDVAEPSRAVVAVNDSGETTSRVTMSSSIRSQPHSRVRPQPA